MLKTAYQLGVAKARVEAGFLEKTALSPQAWLLLGGLLGGGSAAAHYAPNLSSLLPKTPAAPASGGGDRPNINEMLENVRNVGNVGDVFGGE